MGSGESYTGILGKVHTARRLLVKKDLEYGSRLYLRGPADDVTLCHYGASDICRSFGDAVCVMAPATAIYIRKQWCQPCALKPHHGECNLGCRVLVTLWVHKGYRAIP